MRIPIHDILAHRRADRPVILLPHGATDRLDLHQEAFPQEDTVFLSTSRFVVDRLRDQNPTANVQTTAWFTSRKNWRAWDCVVVLGACCVGNLRAKRVRAIRYAKNRGAAVLTLTSALMEPEKTYALAYAMGVEKATFGNYTQFCERFLNIEHRGFGERWIRGVKADAMMDLADATEQMIDRRWREEKTHA